MATFPIFASDTTAAFVGLIVILAIIVGTGLALVSGCAAIATNWMVGKRSWWGLLIALTPILFGVPALLLAISIRGEPAVIGFPNRVLIPVSAAPLFSVPLSLFLWSRRAMRPK